jgi:hypothetical protein
VAWTIWIPILLFTVLGLAGAVRGWVVPWRSEWIFRPRVLGVGTLCLVVAAAIDGVGLSGARRWHWLPLVAFPFMLAGFVLLLVAQAPPRVDGHDSRAG